MDNSIVLVDKRPYRKIAQEHWGLSDEQMKGAHVHHRIPQSNGGTNDPSNLYVCSPWFHANVWHTEAFWIETQIKSAISGGKALHKVKDTDGKSVNAKKLGKHLHSKGYNSEGKSIAMVERHNQNRNEKGKSLLSKKMTDSLHSKKDKEGKSIYAKSLFEAKNSQGIPLKSERMCQGRLRPIEITDTSCEYAFVFDRLSLGSKTMRIPKTTLRRLADNEGRQYKHFKARWL